MLGLYRFNVELATPAGETCHVAIDHGRTEVVPGPCAGRAADDGARRVRPADARGARRGRIGPVDAQVAGRLWVSGSLGTRVLTSCTFRLLRIGGGRLMKRLYVIPLGTVEVDVAEVHGLGARARRALLGPGRRFPDPDRRREERARRHGPLTRPHRGPGVPDPAGRTSWSTMTPEDDIRHQLEPDRRRAARTSTSS